MNLDETIRLQALKQKQLTTEGSDFDLLGHVIAAQPELPSQLRNICAAVSVTLFDEVESTCKMLDISKRRFVELAIVEALHKADAILEEIDPFAERKAA